MPSSTWIGTIEPAREITLQFRIDGKLATKPVDVGMQVKESQTLATLDGSQSREDRAAALADYQEALAAEHQRQLQLERVRKLYAIGTASRAQLEEATASLATLTARKVRALAQKSGALNESGFSTLKAPFDGVVTAFIPYPGQSVTAGQDIVKLASTMTEVQFSIASSQAARLRKEDIISVLNGAERIQGKIRFISPQLDNDSRTSLVRASLAPQAGPLLFGSPVRVEVNSSHKEVIAIPATALTRMENHPAVFIVDPRSGTLLSREISVARFSDEMVYVSSGLIPGDQVVTAGVTTLEKGEKVGIRSEATK